MRLKNKKIILGLSGGIACYKAAELLRLLRQQGAEVRVIMTEAAKQFITPMTMQALSGQPVRDDLFGLEAEDAMSHIELARMADMILIAPASADIIAQLAHGLASNLLTSVCLATQAAKIIVPAMNVNMWENSLTQSNVQRLRDHHFHVWGPASGLHACGDSGLGRLLEPPEILQLVDNFWQPKLLQGKKVLITAGPTQEKVDPVRYFSNFSSGKMGYALAAAAAQQGAKVILISGPTELSVVPGVERVSVVSAQQMQQAVFNHLVDIDIFVGAAAVADYRPQQFHAQKIKKTAADLTIELIRNPDIIAEVAACALRPRCVVGFAAESTEVVEQARDKLQAKNLDFIIANDISQHKGFGADDNEVWILDRAGAVTHFALQAKKDLAAQIMSWLARRLYFSASMLS